MSTVQAAAAPLLAADGAFGRPNAAQRAEAMERYALAGRIVERVAPDAKSAGLAPAWRNATLVALLDVPSAQLMTMSHLTQHAAVMEALARPVPKLLGDPSNDLVFKPFVPCRYIDTRNAGGKINGIRPYDLANNGGVYGGAAACNPKTLAGVANEDQIGALAVNIALLDTSAGAPGFLTMRPAGSTQLTALANWYVASASAQDSNAAVVAIDQTNAVNEVEILSSGAVHVIVDLLGAFVSPSATALDCTMVRNPSGATGDLAPGASAIFQTSCAAGYTITGGGCQYFTPAGVAPTFSENKVALHRTYQAIDSTTGSGINTWVCHWTNNDAITWRVQARAACCRVPGR